MLRFAAALAQFAAFIADLEPKALDAIKKAFASIKVPAVNDGSFSLAPLSEAVPHPAVTAVTAAAHEELVKRMGAGWTPAHVMAAFADHVPQIAEPPGGEIAAAFANEEDLTDPPPVA